MLIKTLLRRATAVWLTGLLLAGLTLAACGGTAESDTGKPAGSTQAVADTQVEATQEIEAAEEVAATEEPEEMVATEEPETVQNDSSAPVQSSQATKPAATCQSVDIPENAAIPGVSDSDWAKGPADASITIIEYGDFQ